jgi:hypothetical protein
MVADALLDADEIKGGTLTIGSSGVLRSLASSTTRLRSLVVEVTTATVELGGRIDVSGIYGVCSGASGACGQERSAVKCNPLCRGVRCR